jgi:hypothetical protein
MLASITPLGERSRGFSWSVTATAFALGSVGAGVATGAAIGAIGSLIPGGDGWRSAALAAVLGATVLLDGTPLRRHLPTHRRQVNEDWLGRYRGWVYGLGFGAQLGVGVATVVNSAAIYAAPLAEFVSGRVWIGAVIGGAFGVVRALSLWPAGAANQLDGLMALHRTFSRAEARVRIAVVGLELLAVVGAVAWLV